MRTSAAVALISFAVYLATFRPFVSMDATTNVLVAYGFVREGTASLDTALPHWNEIPFFWQRYGEHVISWTWYLADALPVLALGLALWLRRHHTSLRARVLVGALAVPSVAIAAIGALVYEWRNALWEDSTPIPTEELVWIPDRMQALYALTTSPRFDALTFFGLGVAVVAAVLLTIVARRPARHPRGARGDRALRGGAVSS